MASARADEITIDVDVAGDAPIGARDLSVAGSVKPGAMVVYSRVDGLKVAPQSGMARVGGVVFPKQLQQFEAIGYSNGPDGKPDTADDLNLGVGSGEVVDREYTATFGDDDAQFVGTLDQNGLFTPNVDGPNPKRAGNRNNVGDVWVVAELTGGRLPAALPSRCARVRICWSQSRCIWPGSNVGVESDTAIPVAVVPRPRTPSRSKPPASRSSISCRAPPSSSWTMPPTPCCACRATRLHARRVTRRIGRSVKASTTTLADLIRVQAIGEISAPSVATPKSFR